MALNNRKTGMALSYTSALLNMVCGLLLSSVLLRALGDFEYGLYQTIAAFISYLVIFEFGTGTVMCRNLLVARHSGDVEAGKKITATVWYITVLLALLILVGGMFFYANIGTIYSDTIPQEKLGHAQGLFLVMMVYLLGSFFNQTLSGTFLGNENYYIGNLIGIIRTVSRTTILVAAAISVKTSMVIALTDAIISLSIMVFSLVYVRRKFNFSFDIRNFDWGIVKTSLPLCFALLLQVLINQANNNVDKLIISIKVSMESVAMYSVAMYIYAMHSSLTTIPISMYMPQVAKSIGQGLKGSALMESMVPAGRLITLVGGTILFGFIAVGSQFVEIVYGAQYEMAWLLAVIVLIPSSINMTGGNIVNVLDVLNKRHVRSGLLAITMVFTILLTVWLVDIWGCMGAAVATAASLILGQVVLMNHYYLKAFSMNLYHLYLKSWSGIIPALFLATLFGGGVGLMIANKYLSFLCGGIVFVLVEAVCLLWFGFNKSEKLTLYHLLQKTSLKKVLPKYD